MRTRVPMWGSTASNRSAAGMVAAKQSSSGSTLLFVMLGAAVPIAEHFFGRGQFRRADQAEAEPLRVGHIPDALGELRVLLLPGGVRCDARGAGHQRRGVVPGAAAHGIGIRLRGF